MTSCNSKRKSRGSVLLLVLAVTLGIITAIVIFSISYVRLTGTQSQQKSAIEAASLAAARELSKIVIDTPQFGFIGLSDSAPNGINTASGDGYDNSVHSINTLMGTTLLDYLIGEEIGAAYGGDEIKLMARQDLDSLKTAASLLMTVLNSSVTPTGSGIDKNGATVRPYQEALNAYNSNRINMAGNSSLAANSLQLSLGGLSDGAPTNVRTPTGWSSSWPSNIATNQRYKSYTTITRNGINWVFAGIGEDVKLVDINKFQTTVSGLPYQFGTIVRAQATQDVNDNSTIRSIRSVACAQPASVYDPLPAPGALVVSYPDGPPGPSPTFSCAHTKFADLTSSSGCLNNGDDSSDVLTASNGNGDYPVNSTSSLVNGSSSWPLDSVDTNHLAHNACKVAFYDWLRRGGTKVNVGAILPQVFMQSFLPVPNDISWSSAMQTGPIPVPAPQIPGGVAHVWRFRANGDIEYFRKTVNPLNFSVVSENQLCMESLSCIKNSAVEKTVGVYLGPAYNGTAGFVKFKHTYDLYIRDHGRNPGQTSGGNQHRGEPMLDPAINSKILPNSRIKIAANANNGYFEGDTISYQNIGAKKKSESPPIGGGAVPLVGKQNDFAHKFGGTPPAPAVIDTTPGKYRSFSYGSGLRPTYQTNGTLAEIRFRRQVDAWTIDSDGNIMFFDSGYVQLKP
ncbi:MAG: hypothetical protein KIT34_17130 [Cyanobacteria bacterium TGS_CYA1]|nr:hypothetical protein [Cyanobacteria bacterium TGS_CYA1]